MATIFWDSAAPGTGDSPAALFFAQRASERERERRRLNDAREAHQQALREIHLRHLAAADGLFDDKSLGIAERAAAATFQHRERDRAIREANRSFREQFGASATRSAREAWLAPLERLRERRIDALDYLHAAQEVYRERVSVPTLEAENIRFDPVLIALPGVRRRTIEGAFHYRNAAGQDILRVYPEKQTVSVCSKAEGALEASIIASHERFGPPLMFVGPREFVDRCSAIAERFGFETAPVVPAADVAAPSPSGISKPAGPVSEDASTSPPPPKSTLPKISDVRAQFPDAVAWIEEQHPDVPVYVIDADAPIAVAGTVSGVEPLDSDHSVAFVVRDDGFIASAIVVPTDLVADVGVGESVRFTAAQGAWSIERLSRPVEPAAGLDAPAPSVEPEQKKKRGR